MRDGELTIFPLLGRHAQFLSRHASLILYRSAPIRFLAPLRFGFISSALIRLMILCMLIARKTFLRHRCALPVSPAGDVNSQMIARAIDISYYAGSREKDAMPLHCADVEKDDDMRTASRTAFS